MSLRILILCIFSVLVYSCQSFSPSEEEVAILQQANQHMISIAESNEQQIHQLMGIIHHDVRHKGFRDADLQIALSANQVYKKYSELTKKLKNSSDKYEKDSSLLWVPDSEDDLSLNDLNYYNNFQLRMSESNRVLQILEKFSLQFGVNCGFDRPEISVVYGKDSVYALVTHHSISRIFLETISLPEKQRDFYQPDRLWVNTEFRNDDQPISVRYFDEKGHLHETSFDEIKKVKIYR